MRRGVDPMIKLYTATSIRTAAIAAIAGFFTMALPAAAHDDCDPGGKHPPTHPHCNSGGGGGGGGEEEEYVRHAVGPGCEDIVGGDGNDWISYNTDQMQMVVNLMSSTPVSAGDLGSPTSAAAGTIVDVMTCGNYDCGSHPEGCDVDTVSSIEKVTLTANDDYVFGGDGAEFFGGGRGDDVIHGGGGDDFIGADRGNDVLIGGPGSDKLRGAEHNDEFRFSSGDFAIDVNDIIEDFNPKADCINLGFGVVPTDFDTSTDYGGKGKTDTRITIQGGGYITVWDVALGPSDIGCP
jgi:Ca2+-binding RTX toxin-like protein